MAKWFQWIFFVVLIAVIVGGGGYAFWLKETTPKYALTTVLRGNVSQTVFAKGTVRSSGEVDLSFKTDGRILFIGVKVGDRVVEGEKIAEIDTGSLKQQIQQARASIAFQSRTLEDMKLYKNKSVFSKEQREAQSANVDNARFALSALEEQMKDTVLFAPRDGIVTKKNFNQGESIAANQVIVSLAGENDLEVQARVPEAAINKVAIGQKAYATFDALPSERIELQVLEIEPGVTVIQGNNYYLVKLALPNQDARIRNGMSPEVRIITATRENIPIIPVSALRGDGDNRFVDVLQPDHKTVRSVSVSLGLQADGGMLEVLSGLSVGDEIVL